MTDFIVALGLLAVLEGLLYATAPGAMKQAIKQVLLLPDSTIRVAGIAAMTVGIVIIWAARG